MVVPRRSSNRRRILPPALLSLALLLLFAACDNVPLDHATYFSDTLSEPALGSTDSIRPSFESTLPAIAWKYIEFGYLRNSEPGEPRRQFRETVRITATEARVKVERESVGGVRVDIVSVKLTCILPQRIQDLSAVEGSDDPVRLRQFDLDIPRIEIPAGESDSDEILVKYASGNSGRPSAGIRIQIPGAPPYLETGANGGGGFRVKRIDRSNRIIYANASITFEVKAPPNSREHRIQLVMDMALSY